MLRDFSPGRILEQQQRRATSALWTGESVMQSDASQLDAPSFLADLVDDVLRPEMEYHE